MEINKEHSVKFCDIRFYACLYFNTPSNAHTIFLFFIFFNIKACSLFKSIQENIVPALVCVICSIF